MIKMSESRRELWNPRKRDIDLAIAACSCPDDVVISKLPRDADLNTGTGIRDGALVLSLSHLKYIRFPLHPLFHLIWRALDLHPMQLNPNSYLQLSAFLALGLQVGVSIDPSDFFHFHDCVPIREEVEYFHFASKPNFKSFVNKPSSQKNWKHRPLLVTGNWAAPEHKCLKIRSTFAVSVARFTALPIPERIQRLMTYLAGSCLDIKKYSTPDILLKISQERSSIIYSHFQPECPEHMAEHERMRERVEKRNRSDGDTDKAVHSFEDPDRGKVDQLGPSRGRQLPPLPYSLPSKPSKLDKKRPGSSALTVKKRLKSVLDPSAHSSRTCLEPASPPTSSPLKSIHLNKEENVALEPGLTADLASGHPSNDGTYVTEEEELVENPGACCAVFQGSCHPAEAFALQKKATQEIMKDTTSRFVELGQLVAATQRLLTRSGKNEKRLTAMNETKDKQLEVLKAELEQERQRARELESQLHAEQDRQDLLREVQGDLSKLKEELRKEKYARNLEFKDAEKRILMETARHFRFGWIQSSVSPDKRIIANPDVLDAKHGLKPGDYEYFHGMKPSDQRSECDSQNKDDQENNNEPEDEVEQDEEDNPEDEDDQYEEDVPEDEDDQDGNDYHDQDESMHAQNSNTIQDQTSPITTQLSLRLNQETSNTTLQPICPMFHPEKITHADPTHASSPSAPAPTNYDIGFSPTSSDFGIPFSGEQSWVEYL